jgi:hypothetical protein
MFPQRGFNIIFPQQAFSFTLPQQGFNFTFLKSPDKKCLTPLQSQKRHKSGHCCFRGVLALPETSHGLRVPWMNAPRQMCPDPQVTGTTFKTLYIR